MRIPITLAMIIGGFVLQAVAYLFLAAPLGVGGVEFSNPRLPFAPMLFVAGVMLVFLAAVFYELLPDHDERA